MATREEHFGGMYRGSTEVGATIEQARFGQAMPTSNDHAGREQQAGLPAAVKEGKQSDCNKTTASECAARKVNQRPLGSNGFKIRAFEQLNRL